MANTVPAAKLWWLPHVSHYDENLFSHVLCSFLDPLKPQGLDVISDETTVSSVKIQWNDDSTLSYISAWKIEWRPKGSESITSSFTSSIRSDTSYTIGSLIAGTSYTASVYGKSGDVLSSEASEVDFTVSELAFIFIAFNACTVNDKLVPRGIIDYWHALILRQ